LLHGLKNNLPVLIESTCNQVNQYGGYSGMTPVDFVTYVGEIADRVEFPRQRIILGGDHLGPYPWRDHPLDQAMEKSRELVSVYVRAGYTKIHLDASMRCADEDPATTLEKKVSARRAADLAWVAEATRNETGLSQSGLRYVIGTEVPLPGGIQERDDSPTVTDVQDVEETIEITREAFRERGLQDAWERVIAVVVQPGVDFGDEALYEYDRQNATRLSHFIEKYENLVFEAHSTDYQTRDSLKQMVEDHFAILKVGPALTYAFRQAFFALAMMEEEMFSGRPEIQLSKLPEILEEAMLEQPVYWQTYYHGDEASQRFARKYSFSDRSRYYWNFPEVNTAVEKLLGNLSMTNIPLSLISQFLPVQFQRIRCGDLENTPKALILDKIDSVISDYSIACWQI
jgi:D-tagatose-1,6-bisphosphate aldolase subunit GatZ/KbaZ